MAALIGAPGAPPPAAVAVTLASVLAVNAVAHVAVRHVLYATLLAGLGMRVPRLPGVLARRVGGGVGG